LELPPFLSRLFYFALLSLSPALDDPFPLPFGLPSTHLIAGRIPRTDCFHSVFLPIRSYGSFSRSPPFFFFSFPFEVCGCSSFLSLLLFSGPSFLFSLMRPSRAASFPVRSFTVLLKIPRDLFCFLSPFFPPLRHRRSGLRRPPSTFFPFYVIYVGGAGSQTLALPIFFFPPLGSPRNWFAFLSLHVLSFWREGVCLARFLLFVVITVLLDRVTV